MGVVEGEKVSLAALQAMKRQGRKIVGVVAWDFQMARIADRARVDLVSVGDSVGMNLWGRTDPEDVTVDEMVLVCRAVRAGVKRALLSCDLPYGPLQAGTAAALAAARRVMQEGGAVHVAGKLKPDDWQGRQGGELESEDEEDPRRA